MSGTWSRPDAVASVAAAVVDTFAYVDNSPGTDCLRNECAFVAAAAVSVVTVERPGNGYSASRDASVAVGIAGSSVGKRVATGCWRVPVPAVSVRCSDMVVRSASVEDTRASSALTALVSQRTI